MNKFVKTLTALVFAFCVIVLVTSDVPSADDVASTAHNLADDAGLEVAALCEPCHTPHMDPTASGTPLWNHIPADDTAWTKRANQTQLVGSSSAACLSCHDGTVGVDQYYGGTNEAVGTNVIGTAFPSTTADLGIDLTRQHPVGLLYPNTGGADTDYKTATSVTTAGLNLDSDEVHCNSCHNPHTTDANMLILQNDANSTLCITCHVK